MPFSPPPPSRTLVFASRCPLVDRALEARLEGLPLDCRVRITVSSVDADQTRFSSWADFEVQADGSVEPATQAPIAGTYVGVDDYGLLWSMTSRWERPFEVDLAPISTTVTAKVEEDVVAWEGFQRRWTGPGVSATHVADKGLVGTLFLPEAQPAPGVIVLGGSDGGTRSSGQIAALLASHGFAALALAYFGVGSLPETLAEIPIEYPSSGIAWLAERPAVRRGGVGVVGVSRGGELALLLASCVPEVSAVVGFSASVVLWGGFPGGANALPAWTRSGRGLSWASADRTLAAQRTPSSMSLTELCLEALAHPSAEQATIQVERIRGPVLLVTGDDDRIWPASRLADICMHRLTAAGHPYPDHHLHYSDAGHAVGGSPGLPTPLRAVHPVEGTVYELGGTHSANAAARAEAWPQVIRFLKQHLPG